MEQTGKLNKVKDFIRKQRENRMLSYEQKRIKDLRQLVWLKREKHSFKLFFYTVVYHVKRFLRKNVEDNINALSGQSAFFIILSIIPFFMFILAVIAIFLGQPTEESIAAARSKIDENIPANVAQYSGLIKILRMLVLDAYENMTSGTMIVIVVMALWSAGKGMYIITDGISRIYKLPQRHVWVFRRVFAMGYTVVLILLLTILFSVMYLTVQVDLLLQEQVSELPVMVGVLYSLRYVISTAVVTLLMTLALKLYLWRKVKDKRYIKMRVLLPGMLFTSLAWDVLTFGVSFYTTHFTSTLYGSLGSVFIIIMWVYFMMLLLLYGVQIDYIYREQFYNLTPRRIFAAIRKKISKKKTEQS